MAEDVARKLLEEYNKSDGTGLWLDFVEDGPCFDTGSAALNRVFGGPAGIPLGRIVELYGAESTGKSALALYLIGLFQKAGGEGILADVARDYSRNWAAVQGVDVNSLLVLHLEEHAQKKRTKKKEDIEYTLESMEHLFDKITLVTRSQKRVCPDRPVLIVWDDIAQTLTKKEIDSEYGSDAMALAARAISAGLKKLYTEMHDSLVTLIIVNQLRTKLGGYVSFEESPGGRALKFYASVRVKVKRKEKSAAKNNRGIRSIAENIKNKIGDPFHFVGFVVTDNGVKVDVLKDD